VLHAVNYINYILASPVHYQGSCLPNYLEDFSGPLVPPPATGPLYESLKPQSQGDTSFMDFVKDLGVIFAVIKTGIEIGKVFMTLIGL
jgi:hypothetical protein